MRLKALKPISLYQLIVHDLELYRFQGAWLSVFDPIIADSGRSLNDYIFRIINFWIKLLTNYWKPLLLANYWIARSKGMDVPVYSTPLPFPGACIYEFEDDRFRIHNWLLLFLSLLRVPYPKRVSAPLHIYLCWVCVFSCFYTGIWDLLFNAGSERLIGEVTRQL